MCSRWAHGQGTGVGFGQAGQDFLFAKGLEDRAVPAVFAPPHLQAQGGAFVEQGQELVVQGVDAAADFQQGFFQGTRGGDFFGAVRVHVILP